MSRPRPQNVIDKRLKGGLRAYYYNVTKYYRDLGCPVANEALGTDYIAACGEDGNGGRAAILNRQFNDWMNERNGMNPVRGVRYGSVDWLFKTYKSDDAYLEKVAPRSRRDYERTMEMVADIVTKAGDRIGDRNVRTITPNGATLIYKKITGGEAGLRLRQGEKAVKLCSKAWRVVRRLYPDEFDKDVPDPWAGVTLRRRVKKTKDAVTRDQVYQFAWGCIERGRPEPAAAAVICFEWLQRPENVLAGKIRWSDYRSKEKPSMLRIEHHKTGKYVLHPLEEETPDGIVRFYEEAEEVLSHLRRLGIPMIMREVTASRRAPDRPKLAKTYSFVGFQKVIRTMREAIGLPETFTLDACRHGGMTELEEAELTDGQGRALSAHSSKAYDGYAKRTEKRALAATRRRHAHVLANRPETEFQNEALTNFRMEKGSTAKALK